MMTEERDFIKTISLLMRLTRKEKIHWSKPSEREANLAPLGGQLPTYSAEYKGMVFHLKDAMATFEDLLSTHPTPVTSSGQQYRLVINDKTDSTKVVSPPMKAVSDLVAVIENTPSSRKKINDINRRLAES